MSDAATVIARGALAVGDLDTRTTQGVPSLGRRPVLLCDTFGRAHGHGTPTGEIGFDPHPHVCRDAPPCQKKGSHRGAR